MKNKYHNIKVKGYDSIKEAKRAEYLKYRQKAGEISNLQEQVRFNLLESFKDNQNKSERAIDFILDFTYFDHGREALVAEDVKSPMTKKLPAYVIKRKLFKSKYRPYIFLET